MANPRYDEETAQVVGKAAEGPAEVVADPRRGSGYRPGSPGADEPDPAGTSWALLAGIRRRGPEPR